MENKTIHSLLQKYSTNQTDLIIVEDEDGTKSIDFETFQNEILKNMKCDSIHKLKSLSLPEGTYISTLGYNKIGDGGAATYHIEYSPASVDDGGLCLFLSTSDTLRAKMMTAGPTSVLAFGAVGDGITDDYSAIQTALNSGCDLFFPNKTYNLGNTLQFGSNTNIDFNGATLKCSNSYAIAVDTSTQYSTNVSIHNLNIVGYSGVLISNKLSSDILLDNVNFTNETNGDYGIRSASVCNITICNCTITSKAESIKIDGSYASTTGEVYGSVNIESCSLTSLNTVSTRGIVQVSMVSPTTKMVNINKCTLLGTGSSGTKGIVCTGNQKLTVRDCILRKVSGEYTVTLTDSALFKYDNNLLLTL